MTTNKRQTRNVIKWEKAWIPKKSYPTKEGADNRAKRLKTEGYKVHISTGRTRKTGEIFDYMVQVEGYIPVQYKEYIT